ncbi:MAG: O-antigen ligase family protein [Ignavibacteria bacterium]
MNTYNAISVLFILLASLGFVTKIINEKYNENKYILIGIYFYCVYQLAVVLPLSYLEYESMDPIKYFSQISNRFFFLLIPMFYFYLASEKTYKFIFYIFLIATLAFIITGFYNYSQGIIIETNTGEIRIVTVVATLFFFVTLTDGIALFGAEKNKIIIIFITLLGILISAHRSVYMVVALMLFIAFFISNRESNKTRTTILAILAIPIVILLLGQIPFVSDIFLSRAEYSFDMGDQNYQDRLLKNLLAFNTFLDNPINGTKLSGYYYPAGLVSDEFFWIPHNFILDILPTQGIIGLFLIVTFILLPLLRLGYKNRFDSITKKAYMVILFYLIISLFNATFFTNSCVVVFAIFASIILKRNEELQLEMELGEESEEYEITEK